MADFMIDRPMAFELVLEPYDEGVKTLAQNFVNATAACHVAPSVDTEALAQTTTLQLSVFAQFHGDVPMGKIAMDFVVQGDVEVEGQQLTLELLGCPVDMFKQSVRGLAASLIENEKEIRP